MNYASPVDSLVAIFKSKIFDLVKLIPSENYAKALNDSPDLMIRCLSDYLPQITAQVESDEAEQQQIYYKAKEMVN